jgi:ATP-dependent Lon protease
MLSMDKNNIYLDENTLKFIIKEFTGEEEGGVRSLKKVLYNIYSRINLLNLTKHNNDIKYTFDTDIKKNDDNKIIIDEETLKKLIQEDKDETESIPPSIEHLYM